MDNIIKRIIICEVIMFLEALFMLQMRIEYGMIMIFLAFLYIVVSGLLLPMVYGGTIIAIDRLYLKNNISWKKCESYILTYIICDICYVFINIVLKRLYCDNVIVPNMVKLIYIVIGSSIATAQIGNDYPQSVKKQNVLRFFLAIVYLMIITHR